MHVKSIYLTSREIIHFIMVACMLHHFEAINTLNGNVTIHRLLAVCITHTESVSFMLILKWRTNK